MVTFKNDYSSFQEGANRYRTTMVGVPDRVPVYAQMHEFCMHEIGVTGSEFYRIPELMAYGHLETMERYGFDIPNIDFDDYYIEVEALGMKIIYNNDRSPDLDRSEPFIKDEKDLHKIRTPDFISEGRFPFVIETYKLFRDITGGIIPTIRFCGPFTIATHMRGIEETIMDCLMNPGFAHELVNRIIEKVIIPYVNYLKKEFPEANAIYGADAMASLPIVNINLLKEWIIPAILRIRNACGPEVCIPNMVGESYQKDSQEMLDFKLQACPHFIEGQDPDVEKIGPEVYKRYAVKHDVPLILGVGSAFFDKATSEEIETRIKHYIEAGGQNGRFVLYLCNLSAETPPGNVRAAIKAIHAHGTYK